MGDAIATTVTENTKSSWLLVEVAPHNGKLWEIVDCMLIYAKSANPKFVSEFLGERRSAKTQILAFADLGVVDNDLQRDQDGLGLDSFVASLCALDEFPLLEDLLILLAQQQAYTAVRALIGIFDGLDFDKQEGLLTSWK